MAGVKSQIPKGSSVPLGFSLIEVMMVLTLILIAASITQPIYQNIMLRAREAALRDTLYTMRGWRIHCFGCVRPWGRAKLGRCPGSGIITA